MTADDPRRSVAARSLSRQRSRPTFSPPGLAVAGAFVRGGRAAIIVDMVKASLRDVDKCTAAYMLRLSIQP
ncbi:hypothetical protein [Methylobacterium symbioticum]|uniref:hypothetical protein n=1 Tax=uncultured Methylobacterium sp. TaxID=157278 RepID=UPI00259795CD|nr:hypothetical protein [uncultured Methylobacterium sp.]